MNELQKFFEGLPSEDVALTNTEEVKPEETTTEETKAPEKDEETEGRKNRRHRRLEEALQKERESNIALNARIQALADVKASQGFTSEMPREWVDLYGDNEASQKAWVAQEKLLDKVANKAKEEALQEFEARQTQAADEQKKFESMIDSELEALEDEHNVDLTSDSPKARKMRREFLEVVQKLSPKDANGTILNYADFDSAFEMYQKTQAQDKPDASRAKEIAARSMQASGTVDSSQANTDSELAYLRSIGIRGI